jgi:long-chain acyl-CoA synthetase
MHTAMSTIPDLILRAVDRLRKPNAFQFKRNGEWVSISTEDFVARVEEVFHGLRALGIQSGDRISILSENRFEWAVADYAAQTMGAIVVPLYPTLPASQIEALLSDCQARLIFVSTLELLEKVIVARKRLPVLKYIVSFESDIYQPGVMRLETLYKTGRHCIADHPAEFRQEVACRQPDDIATIIYTSGTTGAPKGAMLTHRNLISNVLATSEVLPLDRTDVELSFLPLSHIFQRHVDYAAMYAGSTIAYAENMTTVGNNLAEVRPTFAAGVPRFFEKVRLKILTEVQNLPANSRAIFNWALRAGIRSVRTGKRGILASAADRLVFSKIRAGMGGRLRWFVSGGAALEGEVAEFFYAIGVPILEGYGLTETSPVITLARPGESCIGSVGRVVGDVSVRIAEDGEILVRGSNVMHGYFKRPHETAEALRDAWFHTGDIGAIDNDGYLRITDRKKDLIVTSGGKKVAPQPIENRLKLIPYFDNVVLIGDRRNFISALVVPNIETLTAYARSNRISFTDNADLLRKNEILEMAMREIEARTPDLASFERVRKIAFIDRPLTVDSGDLTPTLKVRRSIVEAKFRDRIEELYAA